MRDGRSPSEEEVGASLARIIKKAEQCVVVTSFASNVARVLSVAEGDARRRPPPRHRGARAPPRHPGRDRDRLSAARFHLRRPAALQRLPPRRGGGARHRQPGRAARRHGPHRRERASRHLARQGRSRDLFLAHHSGQREERRPHPQRACPHGRRSRHRPGRARPRHRPPAPRRAETALRLSQAADPRADARRDAPPARAREIRPREWHRAESSCRSTARSSCSAPAAPR